MFKRLFCKHTYEHYNTKRETCFLRSRYVFQFVCTNCNKIKEVNEDEIDDVYNRLKEEYNKRLVFGGEGVDTSRIIVPHAETGGGRNYESPTATLMHEYYLKHGIDLKQLW